LGSIRICYSCGQTRADRRGREVSVRIRVKALVLTLAGAIVVSLLTVVAGPASATKQYSLQSIKHVVVFMQENRSADTYFGQLNSLQPAYEAEPSTGNPNPIAAGTIVPFHKTTLCESSDLNHSWNGEHQAWNNGAMDGFTAANDISSANSDATDPTGSRTMGYYTQADLPYYYSLYNTFATGDRYFQSVLSQTFPNRFYLLAGTSFGHIRNDFPPSGGYPNKTIFELLGNAHVSWKIYSAQLPFGEFFSYVRKNAKNHVRQMFQYYLDAKHGRLPAVSFIDPIFSGPPNVETDEHPPSNVQVGQQFAYSVVSALEKSRNWKSSALFLTYDENGGFYDHVAPPIAVPPDAIAPMLQPGDTVAGFDQLGPRVPVVVISPFSKAHYVSHVVHDHTSITKFIETRFNLPSLTARDAAADPMLEFFSFPTAPFRTAPSFSAPTVTPC
jgi:phospholipase C